MPNTLYPTGRSRFARGEIDWEDNAHKVYLLSATYVYDAAHEFGDDLSGILGTPQSLTGKVVLADGVCDADDLAYPDVGIGETVTAVVILKDTGSLATSPLVYFADTNTDTTPISRPGDGSSIPLIWSAAASRVFKL